MRLTVYFTYSYLECGPVGVTDNNTIPDARMTASSSYDSYEYHHYGRLHETRGAGGWCPRSTTDRTDYLQVDMGEVRAGELLLDHQLQTTIIYKRYNLEYLE